MPALRRHGSAVPPRRAPFAAAATLAIKLFYLVAAARHRALKTLLGMRRVRGRVTGAESWWGEANADTANFPCHPEGNPFHRRELRIELC